MFGDLGAASSALPRVELSFRKNRAPGQHLRVLVILELLLHNQQVNIRLRQLQRLGLSERRGCLPSEVCIALFDTCDICVVISLAVGSGQKGKQTSQEIIQYDGVKIVALLLSCCL